MNSATLEALRVFPSQLEAHYAAFPPELTHWAPPSWGGVPSEPLTAIEQICHVRDVEIDGYHVRFQRTLSEHNPTLASLDAEALAQERSYATANADAVFRSIRAARSQTLAVVSGLSEDELARPAVFEGYGAVNLRGLIHFLCSHDQQHIAGLQWLLGKLMSAQAKHATLDVDTPDSRGSK